MLFGRAHRVVAILALVGACACDDKRKPVGPPDEPPFPPRPAASADAALAPEVERSDTAAAAEARRFVAALRRDKLEVVARRVPTQRIAFSKNRLVQLTESALVVLDTQGMKELSRLPMQDPRRVVASSRGDLLVATRGELLRNPGDPKKAERFARVPLFLDSLLFVDRRSVDQLWVLHGIDPTLYPYQMSEGGKLETLDFLELEGFDRKGFAALKDGSFVYTKQSELVRFFPGGKRWILRLPHGAEPWRILTARRVDQLWLARADGKVQLLQLAPSSLSVEKTLELPGAFDIASNDSELAILRLEHAAGDGGVDASVTRAWTLAVFDASGKELLSVALPLDAPSGSDDDWVQEVTKNRAVVLSNHAPLVAVGGPTWLAAWDVKSKARVLSP